MYYLFYLLEKIIVEDLDMDKEMLSIILIKDYQDQVHISIKINKIIINSPILPPLQLLEDHQEICVMQPAHLDLVNILPKF